MASAWHRVWRWPPRFRDGLPPSPRSPVFGVPALSISSTSAPSSATGQCSTPRGTTYNCPGPSVTSPSRMRIVTLPFSTRKKSSVSSCLCQVNSPFSLATIRSWPLNWPTTRGCQGSLKVASFSARSMRVGRCHWSSPRAAFRRSKVAAYPGAVGSCMKYTCVSCQRVAASRRTHCARSSSE